MAGCVATRVPMIVSAIAFSALLAGCATQPPPAAAPPPAATAAPPAYGSSTPPTAAVPQYVTTANVHVRWGPSVHTRIVGTLRPGTPLITNGMKRGSWLAVQSPTINGWIDSHYLAPAS